jgi:hypothetical protein
MPDLSRDVGDNRPSGESKQRAAPHTTSYVLNALKLEAPGETGK